MNILGVKADYSVDASHFVGTMTYLRWNGNDRPPLRGERTVYGWQKPSGSWQLYAVSAGQISKIKLVKPELVDFSETLVKS
jgi:hypothetical protein